MTHATPRPWKVAGNAIGRAIDNTLDVVCTLPDANLDRGKANAALIVRAVNTHERAKKALQYACRILLTEAENYRDGYVYQPRGKSLLKEAEIIQATLTDMEGTR